MKAIKVVTAAGLLALSFSAHSQVLWDTLVDNELNFYEDQNRESIFDMDNSGSVTVGDVFVGWARIDDRTLPSPGETVGDDLYAIFSVQVEAITQTDLDTAQLYSISYGETTVTGLTMSDLTGTVAPAGSLGAVYEDVGADLINNSPGDIDGLPGLSIFDFIAQISNDTLDLIAGLEDDVDHWLSTALVPTAADAFADLTLLESATITGGIAGLISFHSGMGILFTAQGDEDCTAASTWCWGRQVQDDAEGLATLHELSIQNGDISGASDLLYEQTVSPFFGTWIDANGNEIKFYGASSNADFAVAPVHVPEPSLLALMGISLLGLGVARRRLRS